VLSGQWCISSLQRLQSLDRRTARCRGGADRARACDIAVRPAARPRMAIQPRSIAAVGALNGARECANFCPRRRNILMPNLKLTLACWDYDRTRPLMDGRVKPEGIDLDITVLRPRQTFQRMLDNREFEVSELSLASYTALRGRGDCRFVAVPVAL